jgi:hypothetical protein
LFTGEANYTPSVSFYNAYRLLSFVSEYKIVTWLFLVTPSTGQLPHDMNEKIHTKGKQLIVIPNE